MNGLYNRYIKRILDIIVSMTFIILFSWLYLILAILVRIKLGSPVLFCQERPGYNEKIFKLYKFRTMTDKRDEKGMLLPDGERLTRFGSMLRRTSLDELPEMFNILKGDMSLIGPRPLLVEYLPYYTEEERLRHSVRPGLTGLAQVSGRNLLGWDDRFKTDVEYVRNISFALDVRILFNTVKKVLVRDDIEVDTNKAEGNFAEIRRAKLAAEEQKGNI